MPETTVIRKTGPKDELRARLVAHPSSRCASVKSIIATVQIDQSRLRIEYSVECDSEKLAIPDAVAASRKDGLWTRTCFEVFLAAGDGYYEFNFSPSTEWAAYHFDGYRAGMKETTIAAPIVRTSATAEQYNLYADFVLNDTLLACKRPWSLGLSAVIQTTDGGMSYWALAHPDGAPDFHDTGCFRLQIP